jgi:hypothetical protein
MPSESNYYLSADHPSEGTVIVAFTMGQPPGLIAAQFPKIAEPEVFGLQSVGEAAGKSVLPGNCQGQK